ncbi:MAG: PAS domain S-box protein [candidate division Zixibacteria bacterium]|nr:PAS domain S-box protein [candidate division Zixibacteria bacterium]
MTENNETLVKNYSFKELVDVKTLQKFTDTLYSGFGLPSAIITTDGEILTGSGWQKICTDFHRKNPESEKDCIESDTCLTKMIGEGKKYCIYKCPRGLVDSSSPVIVDGVHVANVFTGQFFSVSPTKETEKLFRKQAKTFGVDQKAYMEAFKSIPVFPEEKHLLLLDVLVNLASMLSEIGLARKRELDKTRQVLVSEDKFRKYISHAPDGIFIVDARGFYVEVNQAACKLTGYSESELTSMSIPDIVASDDDKPSESLKDLQKSGSVKFEFRLRRKDGTIIWASLEAVTISEDRFMAFCSDIAERRLAEEKILQNKVLLESSLESQKDTNILSLDREYRYLYFNRAHSKSMINAYGTKPELGLSIFDIIQVDEDIVRLKAHYDRVLAGDGHTIIEDYGGEDSRLFFEINFNPIYNDDKKIIGLSVFAQDITERKKNEEKLVKLSNERQNSIENMPNAYILWDLDLKILEWNKTAESIFGYTKEEIIGKNAVDYIVPKDDRHLVGDVLKKLQIGEVADYSEKNNSIRKDGSLITCQWHNTPLADTNGKVYAILTLAQDITNHKKAAENLAESERLLKEAQQIADMGSWSWHLKTNDITWSDNLCRIHELEPDEFDGQFETVMSLTYPDDLSYVQENIEKLLTSKQPFDFEYRIVTKTGKVKYVNGSQNFVLDNEGNIDFMTGVLQDITKSKEAKNKLQETHTQLITEQVALRSKNMALKEIMNHMGDEKKQMALLMQANVDRTILPILNRLEEKVDSTGKDYIRLIENSLFDITEPFISKLEKRFTSLTSREIEISNMIKVGLSSKDIANTLNISDQTVIKHRKSIRKKLGIAGHKVNLSSHLKSLPNN